METITTQPQILHLDDHYVAVHKPPGLLVHRTWLSSRDDRFLLQMVRNRLGRRLYPVHRLDRATSGVIVFGLSSEAARRLQAALEAGEVTKCYRAVVRGWLAEDGVVDYPLDDPETGTERRPATTRCRCRADAFDWTTASSKASRRPCNATRAARAPWSSPTSCTAAAARWSCGTAAPAPTKRCDFG